MTHLVTNPNRTYFVKNINIDFAMIRRLLPEYRDDILVHPLLISATVGMTWWRKRIVNFRGEIDNRTVASVDDIFIDPSLLKSDDVKWYVLCDGREIDHVLYTYAYTAYPYDGSASTYQPITSSDLTEMFKNHIADSTKRLNMNQRAKLMSQEDVQFGYRYAVRNLKSRTR